MKYYYRLKAIKKEIENQKGKLYIPNIFHMFKDIGDNYYRVREDLSGVGGSLNPVIKSLSDDEIRDLKFKDEEDMIDYLKQKAYELGIPLNKVLQYKPLLIDIVDNSYLAKVLWDNEYS